jgi:hypothetical protein
MLNLQKFHSSSENPYTQIMIERKISAHEYNIKT